MKSLKRITVDSFQNSGVRGFGFGDVLYDERPRTTAEAFDRLAATGAKFARVGMLAKLVGDRFTLSRRQYTDLLWTIEQLRGRGVYTIPLMAVRSEDQGERLWGPARAAQALRMSLIEDVWVPIVRGTKGRTAVAGFDLINEPHMFLENGRSDNGSGYWDGFVEPLVKRIQSIDPKRVPLVSTFPAGDVTTNPAWGEFIRYIPGTVLTAHMYKPHAFTHAGLSPTFTPGMPYDPYMFEVEQAQACALSWIRAHRIKTGQPVWVGEVSAQAKLPGAAEYARHFIELATAYGFSASWHYFDSPEWHPNQETMALLSAWFRGK